MFAGKAFLDTTNRSSQNGNVNCLYNCLGNGHRILVVRGFLKC